MASIKEIFETVEELQHYEPMPLDKLRKLEIHEEVEVMLLNFQGNFLAVSKAVVVAHDVGSKHFPVQVSLANIKREILDEMSIAPPVRWAVHCGIDDDSNLFQTVVILERKECMEETKTSEKSYILAYGEIWENIECDALPDDSVLGFNPKTGRYRIWYLGTSNATVLDSEVVKQIKEL